MSGPANPWTMVYYLRKEIIPEVHHLLNGWRKQAENIPNDELRSHALGSMEKKAFHCEGAGAYALLTRKEKRQDLLRFIVAYQTISDYLDSLCDWSDQREERDFRMLHESMRHALLSDINLEDANYYQYHQARNDNGYLKSLVKTCQETLSSFPGFLVVQRDMEELSSYYRDLQVYKHLIKEEREPLLQEWFETYKEKVPPMSWYEFGASAGSTLGIFALAAYASRSHLAAVQSLTIKDAYFPYVQGLHIMMDYFIDQEEDLKDGELNFCAYYPEESTMINRIGHFMKQGKKRLSILPDAAFHALIHKGLFAIYLSDEKVKTNPALKKAARSFMWFGGFPTIFFYLNSWVFRRKKHKKLFLP